MLTDNVKCEEFSLLVNDSIAETIRNPMLCGGNISDGNGDFLSNGQLVLRGKCTGSGNAASLRTVDEGNRFLFFDTEPRNLSMDKTRTELALTNHWFKFQKPFYLGFKLFIPKESQVTRKFFYLMQLWQCAPNPPIAGIRIDRGTSHHINFMTRGDDRSSSMAKYVLHPEKWVSFVIKGIVDPSGDKSEFTVWNSPHNPPKTFKKRYGYKLKKCQGSSKVRQSFRLKFGIYKGAEPGSYYGVGFDEIRIGTSFDSVTPWR